MIPTARNSLGSKNSSGWRGGRVKTFNWVGGRRKTEGKGTDFVGF